MPRKDKDIKKKKKKRKLHRRVCPANCTRVRVLKNPEQKSLN